MTFSTTTSGVAAAAAAFVFASALLAACAEPSRAAADASSAVRVMVKLVRSSEDQAAIAAEATRIAGVPVSYAAATSPAWHSLAVHCEGAARCDAAIARLRAAGAIYQAVEIDGKKTRAAS